MIDPDGTPPPRAARYPAFDVGREAITGTDVTMAAVLEADDGAVARGRERLELALTDGHIGNAVLDPWDELFSYPVARVCLSTIGATEAVLDAYAAAEAATLRDRAETDLQSDRSDVTVGLLFDEFGIGASPGAGDSWYVDVPAFLRYSPDTDDWSMPARNIADGTVHVVGPEALTLVERAARARVRAGLPYDLSPSLRESASDVADGVRDVLTVSTPPRSVSVVNPSRLPKCLSTLLDAARDGDDLGAIAEIALVLALGAGGMDARSIRDVTGGGIGKPAAAAYNDRLLGSDGLLVPFPDCETLAACGVCDDPGESCDGYDDPLSAYAARCDDSERNDTS